MTYKKVTASTQHQMMGQLPQQRVTASPPFHRTGMDFAGPFTLRKGDTRRPVLIKAYVCIFVCFATKAAHIELVSDFWFNFIFSLVYIFVVLTYRQLQYTLWSVVPYTTLPGVEVVKASTLH